MVLSGVANTLYCTKFFCRLHFLTYMSVNHRKAIKVFHSQKRIDLRWSFSSRRRWAVLEVTDCILSEALNEGNTLLGYHGIPPIVVVIVVALTTSTCCIWLVVVLLYYWCWCNCINKTRKPNLKKVTLLILIQHYYIVDDVKSSERQAGRCPGML